MAQATNYMEDLVLTALVNGTTLQLSSEKPFIGLLTAAPSDDSSGTECSTASYIRKQVGGTGQSDFILPESGTARNQGEFRWDDATEDWGEITHVALYDAETGGNMLVYGTLTAPVEIVSGDIFKIPPSGFTIQMD